MPLQSATHFSNCKVFFQAKAYGFNLRRKKEDHAWPQKDCTHLGFDRQKRRTYLLPGLPLTFNLLLCIDFIVSAGHWWHGISTEPVRSALPTVKTMPVPLPDQGFSPLC